MTDLTQAEADAMSDAEYEAGWDADIAEALTLHFASGFNGPEFDRVFDELQALKASAIAQRKRRRQ